MSVHWTPASRTIHTGVHHGASVLEDAVMDPLVGTSRDGSQKQRTRRHKPAECQTHHPRKVKATNQNHLLDIPQSLTLLTECQRWRRVQEITCLTFGHREVQRETRRGIKRPMFGQQRKQHDATYIGRNNFREAITALDP